MGCSIGKEEDDIHIVKWQCTACSDENADGIMCVFCGYPRPEGDTTEKAKMNSAPSKLQ
jgi:ribosomal protein L37E